MTMPKVGAKAPGFSLPDQSGETRTLDAYAGQYVVLYFYPKDDTPGCTVEACGFRDEHSALQSAGAVVIGVSPDSTASHKRFAEKYTLPFPLLADTEHSLAEAYGVWTLKKNYGREYMGIQRATFLIAPDGTLVRVWEKVKTQGHAAEVLAALQAAAGGAVPSAPARVKDAARRAKDSTTTSTKRAPKGGKSVKAESPVARNARASAQHEDDAESLEAKKAPAGRKAKADDAARQTKEKAKSAKAKLAEKTAKAKEKAKAAKARLAEKTAKAKEKARAAKVKAAEKAAKAKEQARAAKVKAAEKAARAKEKARAVLAREKAKAAKVKAAEKAARAKEKGKAALAKEKAQTAKAGAQAKAARAPATKAPKAAVPAGRSAKAADARGVKAVKTAAAPAKSVKAAAGPSVAGKAPKAGKASKATRA